VLVTDFTRRPVARIFKLPEPLCVGGLLLVELRLRVQKRRLFNYIWFVSCIFPHTLTCTHSINVVWPLLSIKMKLQSLFLSSTSPFNRHCPIAWMSDSAADSWESWLYYYAIRCVCVESQRDEWPNLWEVIIVLDWHFLRGEDGARMTQYLWCTKLWEAMMVLEWHNICDVPFDRHRTIAWMQDHSDSRVFQFYYHAIRYVEKSSGWIINIKNLHLKLYPQVL